MDYIIAAANYPEFNPHPKFTAEEREANRRALFGEEESRGNQRSD